ncbi:phosphate acyltransferase PlsX [Mycoplasmopsis pullorum]|uniref:phosphate acyltransferase PlsX n=1 Tax=Mycoplasmopsis pullorum TaxID=48003 RepID=UPI00111BC362|nr:phosphate acyltransferase PlsX [Mycoplasmopsis pullorum]TNK83477.1 phosphate acyltransferase PlsX [Mycoplasmopsis pullorum]TNK92371.1 phosphate acyltransferase PlsX [Mycoplasmopsis pullorum]
MKYIIAMDVNGNDHGVESAVLAAVDFLKHNDHFYIKMVGNEQEIRKFLDPNQKNIEIINNEIVGKLGDNPRSALSENSSLKVAIDLVKNNEADSIISCGDSGLYLTLSTFILKRLPGISRPAFMPIMPNINRGHFLLLDVGANLQTKAEYLHEWAILASEAAKAFFDKGQVSVKLLNIGTEDYKGLEITKEAHQIMRGDTKINYQGFIEPRDLLLNTADVVVCDGYVGNIALKTAEGAILNFKNLIKKNIMASWTRKIGYLFLRNAFKDVAESFDYRNVGAAWILGVNHLALKCHGSSDKKSYLGALNQMKLGLEKDVLTKMKRAIDEYDN